MSYVAITPREFFESFGFEVANTGGGCQALVTPGFFTPGTPYMMVTAGDDPSLPESWDSIAIGCYTDDGENLAIATQLPED